MGDWDVEEIILKIDRGRWGDTPESELMKLIVHSRNIVIEMVTMLRCHKPAREPNRDIKPPFPATIHRI